MCIYICISDAVKAHCYVQVTGNERLLSTITVAGIHNDRINVQDVLIFLNWYKTALNQLRKILRKTHLTSFSNHHYHHLLTHCFV